MKLSTSGTPKRWVIKPHRRSQLFSVTVRKKGRFEFQCGANKDIKFAIEVYDPRGKMLPNGSATGETITLSLTLSTGTQFVQVTAVEKGADGRAVISCRRV